MYVPRSGPLPSGHALQILYRAPGSQKKNKIQGELPKKELMCLFLAEKQGHFYYLLFDKKSRNSEKTIGTICIKIRVLLSRILSDIKKSRDAWAA